MPLHGSPDTPDPTRRAPLGELTRDTAVSASGSEDRLDSWKEIAAYLNRDVTTVQRWEKREGMPVHRHLHDKMGSVYAFRVELDAWASSRKLRSEQEKDTATDEAFTPSQGVESPIWWGRLVLLLAAGVAVAIFIGLWLERSEYFWRNPIADARFETITNFDGVQQGAAISRDGHFVAFLSNRDGNMDVWVTQVGSGQFHNLTQGKAPELVNPSVRELAFSPDSSLVTYWGRKPDSGAGDISVYAVPTLGGELRTYLEGVAEYDWSRDGSRLAYHTPGPGDPVYVSDGSRRAADRPIFSAPAGSHAHFQLWSPDQAYIYFVQGSLPDKLDIWRIRPTGGPAERITSHNGRVTHPVFLDRRTLLYLASDKDGSGPWLYSIDVERRIPHRLSSGIDSYASLAASADGRRLVATLANPKRTLWRLSLSDTPANSSALEPIALNTGTGFSPRLGPDFLLYVSSTGSTERILKMLNGSVTELWRGDQAHVIGGPAISADGKNVAFVVRKAGRAFLYAMRSDGANTRIVSDSLDLQGAPAWSPDGQFITVAVNERGVPQLFRLSVDGRLPTRLLQEYSTDPTWSPDGRFVIYSGPDIGTKFPMKAASPEAAPHPLPALTLSRGARHVVFVSSGPSLVLMQGEIQHKDLWLIDLKTGTEKQVTRLAPDFNIRDFDVSPDGHEVVLEREQESSNIVMLELSEK